MKRGLLFIALLVFAIAFLFAGGTQEKPAVKKAAAQEVQREKTPIEIYNEAFKFPTKKIQLSYWHVLGSRPGYNELALEIAKEYSKIHPNVSIKIRSVPNSQQRAIWSSAFESNTAPDVCWIEAQVGLMAKGLRKAPEWAVKMMKKTFTPYGLNLSNINGVSYGWIGSGLDVGQMLYYRKDIFRQNGLDPESPPKTLPEWLETAKKCTKYDSKGDIQVAGVALRYAGGHQGVGDKFSKYAAAFVDTTKHFYYNKDYTDVIFDDPGWIEAGHFIKNLIFTYKVTNTQLPIPIQAELEAKLGDYVLQIMTDPNSEPEKLFRQLAEYGRKRIAEVRKISQNQ